MKRRRFLLSAGLVGVASACGSRRSGGPGPQDSGSAVLPFGPSDFASSNSCVATQEEITGPYYIRASDIRRSIAEDREGWPLALGIQVRSAQGDCQPLSDVLVEVWHCDARGLYSGFDADPDKPAGSEPVHGTDTRFCRGGQSTDPSGIVAFQTLFPGWYAGRATHIHVRVHLPSGQTFTTQIYFHPQDQALVYDTAPYDELRDAPLVSNARDGVTADKLVRVVNPGEAVLRGTVVVVV